MYIVGENFVDEEPLTSISEITPPIPYYRWRITFLYRDGAIKKRINVGAGDFPIKKFRFLLANSGCVTASIDMENIDYPIDIDDQIIIEHKARRKYRGWVEAIPDDKGGKISIAPYLKKLSSVVFRGSFSTESITDRIKTILDATDDFTNVRFNLSAMDMSDNTGFPITYDDEKVKKTIEDYIDKQEDRHYGVFEFGYLHFRAKKSGTNYDYIIFNDENAPFESVTEKIDTKRIKNTRLELYQKSGAGQITRIGRVGFGGAYPIIDLETIIGTRIGKFTIPEGLDSTGDPDSDAVTNEGKDYGFATLTAMTTPSNTKIKNMDIDRIDAVIGDRILIFDKLQLRLRTIIDCDSLTGWNNGTLSTDRVEGTNSVRWDTSTGDLDFDFGEVKRYNGLQKIIMRIKSSALGTFIKVTFKKDQMGWGAGAWGEDAWGVESEDTSIATADYFNINIFISNLNGWNLIELYTDIQNIRYVSFTASKNAIVLIDDIQIYDYNRKTIDGNVIKLTYNIDSPKERFYDLELGDYDEKANDKLFELDKKVAQLVANQNT